MEFTPVQRFVTRLFAVFAAVAGPVCLAGMAGMAGTAAAQQVVNVVAGRAATMQLGTGQPFVGTVIPARTSDVGSAVDG